MLCVYQLVVCVSVGLWVEKNLIMLVIVSVNPLINRDLYISVVTQRRVKLLHIQADYQPQKRSIIIYIVILNAFNSP